MVQPWGTSTPNCSAMCVTLSSLEDVGLFSSMLSSPLSTEITKGASLPFWAGLALPAINAPMPRHDIQDKHYHKNDQTCSIASPSAFSSSSMVQWKLTKIHSKVKEELIIWLKM